MGFGELDWLCTAAPVPLCAVVGSIHNVELGIGIEAECYARNIELANTIIFQGASSFMHIVALVMTVIMILHVRSKFTAVGESNLFNFTGERIFRPRAFGFGDGNGDGGEEDGVSAKGSELEFGIGKTRN
jgi:hypothetical protein